MTFANPQYLVSTEWLASHIDDPSIRVLDCTVFLRPPAPDSDRRAYVQESGLATYTQGHIPGALFADLIHDLSDDTVRLPFTRPSAEKFAATMGKLGISNQTRVICYDGGGSMWATRTWWLLRAFGHDNAAVLDGGWRKWLAEGRPTSTVIPAVAPATFAAVEQPARWAEKEDILAAVQSGNACVINALSAEQHAGQGTAYGRAGHIAGSVNVAVSGMTDPATGAFLPVDALRAKFADVGATTAERVITYCGGGIAATGDAFALALLGFENVSVYDNSLSEWARDESLPMEVGAAAGQ